MASDASTIASIIAVLVASGCGALVLLLMWPSRLLDPIRLQRDLDLRLIPTDRPRRKSTMARLRARVRERLDRAGHDQWSLAVFAALTLGSSLLGGLLGWTLLHIQFFALVYGGIGAAIPWLWLGRVALKRELAHEAQVAHLIMIIASAVSTGQPIQRIVSELLPRTVGPPLGDTIRRATRRLDPTRGVATVTFADVLNDLDARLHSAAFSQARLLIVEATMGGMAQLPASLEMVASLARDAIIFRNETRAQFAITRATGSMIFVITLAITLVLHALDPSDVEAAYNTPLGWIAASIVLLGSAGGYYIVTAKERRAARDLLTTEEMA